MDNVFAYETNGRSAIVWNMNHSEPSEGFGGRYLMDDANVPVSYVVGTFDPSFDKDIQSLLSLPYLGFLDKENPTYIKTRQLLMSSRNPYFSPSKAFNGIGYIPSTGVNCMACLP